jgi:hypothetical protein
MKHLASAACKMKEKWEALKSAAEYPKSPAFEWKGAHLVSRAGQGRKFTPGATANRKEIRM